jgi:hypothetical protein
MLTSLRTRIAACAGLVAMLGLGGCAMDEVSVPGGLVGPSELGISVELSASPPIVNADGVSQSVVTATVRDQNGRPLAGKLLFFQLWSGDGAIIAGGVMVGPLQTGLTVASGANGVAQIVYQAGYNAQTVSVSVQPFVFDMNGAVSRYIEIWQR